MVTNRTRTDVAEKNELLAFAHNLFFRLRAHLCILIQQAFEKTHWKPEHGSTGIKGSK